MEGGKKKKKKKKGKLNTICLFEYKFSPFCKINQIHCFSLSLFGFPEEIVSLVPTKGIRSDSIALRLGRAKEVIKADA